mmetsp:Transcript_5168/g.8007  ORF Transcript_5168/g.8007 Transcript_5168/m.8007 type:complete len:83 (+) Transcript_5168:157-405(+)
MHKYLNRSLGKIKKGDNRTTNIPESGDFQQSIKQRNITKEKTIRLSPTHDTIHSIISAGHSSSVSQSNKLFGINQVLETKHA